MIRHLARAAFRTMPWKNGLGTTTEIAVHPEGASLDGFDWRVSVADVRASGPFSRFPGCDRILVQLEGPPMTLTHQGSQDGGSPPKPPAQGCAPHRLSLLVPYAFAGELATDGAVDGPARDFNLIVRRGAARGCVATLELAPGSSARFDDAALVFVLRGAIEAEGARAVAEEALRIDGGRAEITAAGVVATVLVVSFERGVI